MTSIMQKLHDSEINASISSFYFGVWTARIGDEMNGFVSETTSCESFEEAEAWLDAEARRLFPNSLYATGQYPEGHRTGPDGAPLDGSVSLDGEGVFSFGKEQSHEA